MAEADVIIAATTATVPFIEAAWVRPGSHVGLFGAFTSAMAEAVPALLANGSLFADTRAGVLEKGGEVTQAIKAGLISPQAIRAEFSEMVAGDRQWRQNESEITVLKSVGFAALDLLAARHVLAVAGEP